jgi:hypothetical protein
MRFSWSLEDIEEVLGHVAATANHIKDRKLEKRLHRISDKLQDTGRLTQRSLELETSLRGCSDGFFPAKETANIWRCNPGGQ